MPCSIPKHEGQHNWPDSGEMQVWPCERVCAFCDEVVRDSTGLRAHIREIHCGKDKPGLTVAQGRTRPGSFICRRQSSDNIVLNVVGSTSKARSPAENVSPAGRPVRATTQPKNEFTPVSEEPPKPKPVTETYLTRRAASAASAAQELNTQDPQIQEPKAQELKAQETKDPEPKRVPRARRKPQAVRDREAAAQEVNSGQGTKRKRQAEHIDLPGSTSVPAATAPPSPPVRRGQRKRARTSRALEVDNEQDSEWPASGNLFTKSDVPTDHSAVPVSHSRVPAGQFGVLISQPGPPADQQNGALFSQLNGAVVAPQSRLDITRGALRTSLESLVTLCEEGGLGRQEIFDIVSSQMSAWVFRNDPGVTGGRG
ncbi:hypothetical protein K490DRAFT_62724 [Saccharata proteae CBS 121410]|uniref:C2H2-type domain-containing protein n=1 Tax=Saccharata proteae CBS 121410 TaxID=1314787 RepID=A0A9P4M052_9PEZI|nr:hypothetical protein K490DRAFT_62724 [Saccharata proteae CBS 121410]